MRVSRLSSHATGAPDEIRRVLAVPAVDPRGSPGSGSGRDRDRDAAAVVIQDLLELREQLDDSRPDEDSVYRQRPFDPHNGDEEERIKMLLAQVERRVQEVAERHRRVLEREAPSETRALELASRNAYVELAAGAVVRAGSPASSVDEEASTETRYELYYVRVAQSLDRLVEALISDRHEFLPGSLLDVEA